MGIEECVDLDSQCHISCSHRVNGRLRLQRMPESQYFHTYESGHFPLISSHVGSHCVDGRMPGIPDLKGIMETVRDPNIYMIGFNGKDDDHMDNLLNTITRRVTRDELFGVIVMVSISDDKPNLITIQQDIAHQLGFTYQEEQKRTPSCCVFPTRNRKAVITENAKQLFDRILTQPKILFILRNLHTKLDLAKLGIPSGQDHNGCKLILTSQSNEILSNQMNVQRICYKD